MEYFSPTKMAARKLPLGSSKASQSIPYNPKGAWQPGMSAPTASQKASINRGMKFDSFKKSVSNKASSAWRGTKKALSSFANMFRRSGKGRSRRRVKRVGQRRKRFYR
jgi:hypothetical protein